ncbi:hypothetical protein Dimus_014122 [Dionaea muscipula]
MTTTTFLSPSQRYAAGTLFALSLHQAQIHHQPRPLALRLSTAQDVGDDDDRLPISDRISSSSGGGCSSGDPLSEDPELWINQVSGLLRPVFKLLEIDPSLWTGIEETAGASPARHHVGAFLRLLSEENEYNTSEKKDQELALAKAVDAMALTLDSSAISESKREKQCDYENDRREKCSILDAPASSNSSIAQPAYSEESDRIHGDDASQRSSSKFDEEPLAEEKMLAYERKVTLLYEILSCCLADVSESGKPPQHKKGYDARHRVALRLLATWLDIKWVKVEAIETIIACSAMALVKEEESKEEETKSKESSWTKWNHGGIIGAAALTGGTLLAITGGLAAPAIAAGFSALAPTLGTLVPVIGASGFAAAASAAGTVAGSVAIAASFGAAGAGLTGYKMSRRIGSVDEFEFKAIGENHKQGRLAVEILVSGFVFDEVDFVMPWEGLNDTLERYALQWESKNLIAVSTAIQDWLTSRLAMELMRKGAMMTILSTLLTALAWPATLLTAADFIDSKWTIAVDRSDKAGKLLAEVLLKGLQGNRPVTLVGYSLGARVIFKCLKFLHKNERNANVVERVVLLGAPIPIRDENWEAARKTVAGRFINVYSRNDWILGVAFRASMLTQGLAGIQPIDVPGIENVDVTNIIQGHSSYLWATVQILDLLELDTYFPVFRCFPAKQ